VSRATIYRHWPTPTDVLAALIDVAPDPERPLTGDPVRDVHAEVDALCDRLVAYFDTNAPLTAQEVRSAVFTRRKGARAYAEGPVDAFLERAVDVLLAAE
jgi:DivIVA domain-containing protein